MSLFDSTRPYRSISLFVENFSCLSKEKKEENLQAIINFFMERAFLNQTRAIEEDLRLRFSKIDLPFCANIIFPKGKRDQFIANVQKTSQLYFHLSRKFDQVILVEHNFLRDTGYVPLNSKTQNYPKQFGWIPLADIHESSSLAISVPKRSDSGSSDGWVTNITYYVGSQAFALLQNLYLDPEMKIEGVDPATIFELYILAKVDKLQMIEKKMEAVFHSYVKDSQTDKDSEKLKAIYKTALYFNEQQPFGFKSQKLVDFFNKGLNSSFSTLKDSERDLVYELARLELYFYVEFSRFNYEKRNRLLDFYQKLFSLDMTAIAADIQSYLIKIQELREFTNEKGIDQNLVSVILKVNHSARIKEILRAIFPRLLNETVIEQFEFPVSL